MTDLFTGKVPRTVDNQKRIRVPYDYVRIIGKEKVYIVRSIYKGLWYVPRNIEEVVRIELEPFLEIERRGDSSEIHREVLLANVYSCNINVGISAKTRITIPSEMHYELQEINDTLFTAHSVPIYFVGMGKIFYIMHRKTMDMLVG
ncbi:hypothetical protein ABGN05_29640 [Aquibium sp. LZ166]|uniref:SpoVT-AbrB domain-containing protein n=1 Tax=Aquibium pacificus TaxID=3153579 RepID=A0ABV3STK1_9HYPH